MTQLDVNYDSAYVQVHCWTLTKCLKPSAPGAPDGQPIKYCLSIQVMSAVDSLTAAMR